LNLVGHILDVTQSALLLGGRSRDGLRTVLSLRVGTSRLPASSILGGRLSGRSRSSSSSGGSGSGSRLRSRSGGSRSRSSALGRNGRSRSLGERNNGPGESSGGTAGPGHRLWGRGRLNRGGRSSDRLGNRRRAGVLGLLWLLDIFLSNLLGGSISVGSGDLGLGLRGLRGLSLLDRRLSSASVQSGAVLRCGNLLQLLVHDLGVELSSLLLSLLDRLGGFRLDRSGSRLLLSNLGLLNRLFGGSGRFVVSLVVNVSQDIVEDKVTRGLLSENKGLDELLGLTGLVGSLANNLNDNVFEGSLGVNVGYSNLAVLEVEGLDAFLDGLL
jgi:hypothetical protein